MRSFLKSKGISFWKNDFFSIFLVRAALSLLISFERGECFL